MKSRPASLIILSFLHLIVAIGWLSAVVVLISSFFIPSIEIAISSVLAVVIIILFCFGVAIYYLYILVGLLKQKEKSMALAGNTSIYLFFIILVLWLPGDFARGEHIRIFISVLYLTINLIIWFHYRTLLRERFEM